MSIRYCFAVTIVAVTVLAKLTQGIWAEEAKIVRHIPTEHKVIALTFDDGPHPKTTPELLRILKEKNAKATFFVLGENAEQYPQLVAKANQAGHEIASHGYTHRHLKNLSRQECAEELDKTTQIIEKLAPKPQLFRPPGGLYDDKVLEEAKQRGYTTILWSVDPMDWKRPSVDYVVQTVLKKAQSGGIILLHDGLYPLPTPKAVVRIIDSLRAKGYALVTVGELLQYEKLRETGQVS